MKKICLISDTHSYLDEPLLKHMEWGDEIWHGGDVGNEATLNQLVSLKPVRGVFGNIDSDKIRIQLPEYNYFEVEGVRVLMLHIGGYPPKYNKQSRELLMEYKPDLFISGHSHILKILRDPYSGILHMNPGAAGIHGFHKMRTFIRFKVDGGRILEPQVVELGKRGTIK